MITTPAICRFRKLGCAVTAKVKIAPMAIKVRQLAVLICHSSHGGFRTAGSGVPPGSAAVIAHGRERYPDRRHAHRERGGRRRRTWPCGGGKADALNSTGRTSVQSRREATHRD